MKKKGFTLVELLAVIAILAILVIMALPAVLRMYRQSRINSFQNEVRSVYRTAQSQFLSDSMLLESGEMIAYTNAGEEVEGVDVVKKLDMTGNTDFKYYVLINVDGKVLNVRASNGTYSYSKQATNAEHDLKIEDIDVEKNNDSTLDDNITTTVCPTTESTYGSSSSVMPSYIYSVGLYSMGDTLIVNNTTVFDNFEGAKFNNHDFTLAYITNDNNIITELYVAYKLGNNIYYLQGGNSELYDSNTQKINTEFPNTCRLDGEGTKYEMYYCYNSSITVYAFASGAVEVQDNGGDRCSVSYSGTTRCEIFSGPI